MIVVGTGHHDGREFTLVGLIFGFHSTSQKNRNGYFKTWIPCEYQSTAVCFLRGINKFIIHGFLFKRWVLIRTCMDRLNIWRIFHRNILGLDAKSHRRPAHESYSTSTKIKLCLCSFFHFLMVYRSTYTCVEHASKVVWFWYFFPDYLYRRFLFVKGYFNYFDFK